MYPEWNELARLLADHPDVIIAKMDTDENEKDPYYLPENYVPNIKLFKKNDKRNYVPYINGMRTVAGFLEFLGHETDLQLGKLMASKYPAYRVKMNVVALLDRTREALMYYCPPNVDLFLSTYFTDPLCFPIDASPAQACNNDLKTTVELALQRLEAGLASTLPEQPESFLANHFFPLELTVSDTHRSEFGYRSLDREGLEPLSRKAQYEMWPDVTRSINVFKVSLYLPMPYICMYMCVCISS